jgi:hypothetical protein
MIGGKLPSGARLEPLSEGAAGQCVACASLGLARWRIRLGLITLMIGLSVICGWDYLLGEQAVRTTPIREVSPAAIADRVQKARGHALILSLYRPGSDDPYTVADVRRWTVQSRGPDVEVVAVAVGSRHDAQLLFRYGEDQGMQRLPPEWLTATGAGTLDSVLGRLGVRSGALPITAVFSHTGVVTAQWQGTLDYDAILSAAKAAR